MTAVLVLSGLIATARAGEKLPVDPPGLRSLSDLSPVEYKQLLAGESWFGSLEVDGVEGAQAITYVPVSLNAAWQLMTDYESFADWIEGIEAITSVTRPEPNVALVGYAMGALVKTLHYVLRRVEWPLRAQRWTRASGDLEAVIGGYDFYPVGATGTIIRFHTIVDAGVWIPGFIKRHFSVKGLRNLIRDINAEARRRYPNGGPPYRAAATTPASNAVTEPR